MMDEGDMLRGYGIGAVDYLTKPVNSEVLRQKIAVFVELFRKSRALAHANATLHTEVAERLRAEAALRDANRDLEQRVEERTQALQQADRRKDEFLASLAHELRNPLAPIRSAVEVLQIRDANGQDAERARAVIVRQVAHMTRLIDDLLDVSRITVDKLVLQKSHLDLAQVVATAVEASRPLIAERNHRLWISLPSSSVTLSADPARLAQVLSNLLTNAAKYTEPGGDIWVTAQSDETHVVVSVRDNGIGIDPAFLPRVFDLFTQGDHPGDTSAGGLGIGLTLARRLVEMHDGQIEAESQGLGTGSNFSVRLPLLPCDLVGAVATGEEDTSLPASRRVLIVDDNQDAAEMLGVMMTAWGQDPKIAHDGLAALEAGAAFEPEIILLDIGLPRLDGHETARRMRAQTWGRRALLIALTGWGQDVDMARSRDAGFDHHLVKPVDPRVLKDLIRRDMTKPG
jgi:signal transduction histidine kinase/ActR/RegA family two-component response regulator